MLFGQIMEQADERYLVGLSRDCLMTFRNVLMPGRSLLVAGYTLVVTADYSAATIVAYIRLWSHQCYPRY